MWIIVDFRLVNIPDHGWHVWSLVLMNEYIVHLSVPIPIPNTYTKNILMTVCITLVVTGLVNIIYPLFYCNLLFDPEVTTKNDHNIHKSHPSVFIFQNRVKHNSCSLLTVLWAGQVDHWSLLFCFGPTRPRPKWVVISEIRSVIRTFIRPL